MPVALKDIPQKPEMDDWVRAYFAGRTSVEEVMEDLSECSIFSNLCEGVFRGISERSPTSVVLTLKLLRCNERQSLEKVFDNDSGGPKLENTEVIVSGGRGIGGPEGFIALEELAKLMGGAVGASRPPCDLGWISPAHQVGITGINRNRGSDDVILENVLVAFDSVQIPKVGLVMEHHDRVATATSPLQSFKRGTGAYGVNFDIDT